MTNISIGIRVKPECVVYSIIKRDDDTDEILIVDKVNVPVALEKPEQLKFIRSTFLDILYENKVNKACIRISESTAYKDSIDRVYIEAVIQELLASSSIEKYYVGRIASISSRLGIHREDFKKILIDKEYSSIEKWNKYNKEEKESILASLSALNI